MFYLPFLVKAAPSCNLLIPLRQVLSICFFVLPSVFHPKVPFDCLHPLWLHFDEMQGSRSWMSSYWKQPSSAASSTPWPKTFGEPFEQFFDIFDIKPYIFVKIVAKPLSFGTLAWWHHYFVFLTNFLLLPMCRHIFKYLTPREASSNCSPAHISKTRCQHWPGFWGATLQYFVIRSFNWAFDL